MQVGCVGLKASQGFINELLQVFVIAYAGSQVTKAPRLAGAVVLAPTMDRLLDQIQGRLRLASKWQAGGWNGRADTQDGILVESL